MTTKGIGKLGAVLMSVGFLAGSVVLVQHPGHIVWWAFAVTFVVTAIGATLLRVAKARSGGATEKVSADMDTIRASLEHLVSIVTDLNAADRSGELVFDVCKHIDEDCMDPINEFVEAREAMIQRFGLSEYAEMMDSFALGERALNRAWCASADGYIDEVDLCLNRAEKHLGKALASVEARFASS